MNILRCAHFNEVCNFEIKTNNNTSVININDFGEICENVDGTRTKICLKDDLNKELTDLPQDTFGMMILKKYLAEPSLPVENVQ